MSDEDKASTHHQISDISIPFLIDCTEEPVVNRFAGRRKSVFAEQYDPEEDEEDENNKVIFPKTDEQRSRLSDSVKNILLFRALDPEQVKSESYFVSDSITMQFLLFPFRPARNR